MKKSFALFLIWTLLTGVSVFSQTKVQDLTEIDRSDSAKLESRAVANRSTATLQIHTNVSNVECYLNNEYKGKSPLFIDNMQPGSYYLRLSKNGYYDREFYLTLNSGTDNTIYVELRPKTGFLSFTVNPQSAVVYLDGQPKSGYDFELTEGTYRIEVKAFGYETYLTNVTVYVRQHSFVNASLTPVAFSAETITGPSKAFNPQNPGKLGQTSFAFSVTAPGRGSVIISDNSGNTVREMILPTFSTWGQSVFWNGKDRQGKIVPDGVYTVTLKTWGINDPETIFTSQTKAVIDSRVNYPLQSLGASGGGIGLNSSPLFFPAGTISTSLDAWATFDISEGKHLVTPIHFNFLYGPLPWLEVSLRAGAYIQGNREVPFYLGTALKAGSYAGRFLYAGYIRYGATLKENQLPYSESGLAPGIVLGVNLHPVTLSANAEFVMSPEQGLFSPFTTGWTGGISARFQHNMISGALWGKTESAKKWFGGIDFAFFLPNSNIMLSAQYFTGWDSALVMGTALGATLIY